MIEVMRKAVRSICIAILSVCLLVSNVAFASEAPATRQLSAAVSAKTYYVEGAMGLPYTDKFEFLKSGVRKPFKAVNSGYVKVSFKNVRNTKKSRSKLHVRIYYRAAKSKKWIKGSHEAFWITEEKQDVSIIMNVPKGRPFYVRLYKTNNKTIPTKGRIRIERFEYPKK